MKQLNLYLDEEYRQKAARLAHELKLMNPKHPAEPSISELFRYLIDEKIKACLPPQPEK